MRIAFFGSSLVSSYWNGAATYYRGLLRELAARGNAITFYERFLEITHGLTTVVISHRFSTVRLADHIYVVEDGRVVEQGSHDELVALGGTYASMFLLQSTHFTDGDEEVLA